MNSRLLLLLCLPFALLSCSTLKPVKDPASRHLLDPAVPYRAGHSSRPSLAIARPALPAYLDRQQIVTRDGTGAIKIQDNTLWSEPLDSGIARVTAANLSRLTGSTSILPVGDFISLDYTGLLELRIAQFDPDATGSMILECTWRVQPVRGSDVAFRSFRTVVLITPTLPPMTGRISAMNEALGRLARDIARSL
ncbi:PqiC family protein [Prosthecobacter sp. SYSU 5D2]|uniref:PqiC family protein n=1 Tax=Prosthecobacter sp. SYSU 5D2 TaxID=3134134 RepID=UPI0031FE8F61